MDLREMQISTLELVEENTTILFNLGYNIWHININVVFLSNEDFERMFGRDSEEKILSNSQPDNYGFDDVDYRNQTIYLNMDLLEDDKELSKQIMHQLFHVHQYDKHGQKHFINNIESMEKEAYMIQKYAYNGY